MYRQRKIGMGVVALGWSLLMRMASATPDDTLITQAKEAWRDHDRPHLIELRDQALREHHPLAMWVDYWELNSRLSGASAEEVDRFFARWPQTYVEDRMRNDWLLELGHRRDWGRLLAQYPNFRMNDDREVRCYVLLARHLAGQTDIDGMARAWLEPRDSDQACTLMAATLTDAAAMPSWLLWSKLRMAVLTNRAAQARQVAALSSESLAAAVDQIMANPLRYLSRRASARTPEQAQLSALALAHIAVTASPQRAAAQLLEPWQSALPAATVAWVWASIGREAALAQLPEAADDFARSRQWLSKAAAEPPRAFFMQGRDLATDEHGGEHWWDELLLWQVRSAVRVAASDVVRSSEARARQWRQVLEAIDALSQTGRTDLRNDPAWVYWRARAMLALGDKSLAHVAAIPSKASSAAVTASGASTVLAADSAPGLGETPRPSAGSVPGDALATTPSAREALISIVSPFHFYGQLAAGLLGGTLVLPENANPPTAEERAAIRRNPGLTRALALIDLGLRPEGVREWNYTLNYGRSGGLDERELLAAAQWACDLQVWDRCINASERSRAAINVTQRYPTPFRSEVLQASTAVGLDPALMYGLIRQESRFVVDARSGVGAAGLMQLMPATARWTAHKLGLDFTADQITHTQANLRLGAGYLRLLLSDFDQSQALAAAAYNAGPNRPRRWRQGPSTETAAWIENIPFSETRDYVKKVLANASVYTVVLSAQDRPVELRSRLQGEVGPLPSGRAEGEPDMP